MAYFISSLIEGIDRMEEMADWVNDLKDPALGVELIAFTHDENYWRRLEIILDRLICPVSFHGPYIGTEGTASEESQQQAFLLESYEKVLRLAAVHQVCHVVYHYTQKGFTAKDREAAQTAEQQNRKRILRMASHYKVNLLIENLAEPKKMLPLYTLEEYAKMFADNPGLLSIIDIGHAHMNGMNLENFLKNYGKNIKSYHFHNNDGNTDGHRNIFDGTFDFAGFSSLYQVYTAGADIVLEYEPHVNLSHQELLSQINWLRQRY